MHKGRKKTFLQTRHTLDNSYRKMAQHHKSPGKCKYPSYLKNNLLGTVFLVGIFVFMFSLSAF